MNKMKMEMNKKNMRFLSRMGSRGAFGQAVLDIAEEKEFFVMSADLGHASGFDRFIKAYPERYVNVGIAEQNLIGVAAGVAKSGIPVIATTYAPFASMRCADQVRNYMGYMGLNVKLIGLDSGMIQSKFGGSHYGTEDISLMRAIPNLTILSPSDGREIYESVYTMLDTEGPVYLRLTGGGYIPEINCMEEYHFESGKATMLKQGTDIAFIGTGTILKEVLGAAEILENNGVSCAVINMHTIKPLDKKIIEKFLDMKMIVSVEEHSVMGGLGSAIAEHLCQLPQKPLQLLIGIEDMFPHPGEYEYLLDKCGLTSEKIAEKVRKKLIQP